LILPSVEEGLALVQAQALACGIPIIVSKNTGSEEMITSGKEGIILNELTTDDLIDAIIRLIKDDNLREYLAENALIKAKSINGWKNYANNVVKAYSN
jgi:glycosyltransferase involved in cell wall biosynthesis